MSNTRYIEIDSTYRNRSRWSSPAQFEIDISQSGTKNKANALDPVCLSAPEQTWCGNTFDADTPGATITTTVVSVSSDAKTFIVTDATGELQTTKNFYLNAVANNTTLTQLQRIAGYRFLGAFSAVLDHAEITLYTAFGSAFAVGDTVTITDPSLIAAPFTGPDIFVPDGRLGRNAYFGCRLYNENLGDSRPISGYSSETHMLQLDTSTAAGGPVDDPWLVTHCYAIRKEDPSFRGVTPGVNTTTTVVLPVGSNATDDFYIGDFLRVAIRAWPVAGAQGEMRRITDYDATTRTVTVSPPFSSTPVAATDVVEILQFSYDNATPFNYTGSLVSQSQEVCYEIELINLVLPNRTLNAQYGSRISFYPYVYVQFQNASGSSAGTNGIIYSNNPNAVKKLFRAAVDDISDPLLSPFIKIDGDGAVQTVKFKPNDNLKFSVTLPNGDLFATEDSDTSGPVVPNALVQISAMFSVKRL